MIVHTNDLYSYLSDTQCSTPYVQDVNTLDDVITRTDLSQSVVWLLAAFPFGSPRVYGLTCKIGYTSNLWVDSHWLCGPPGSFEFPESGWPEPHTHNMIGFSSPIIGDTMFPFYGFLVWNDGGPGSFCTELDFQTTFVDDSMPPVEDPAMGWGCGEWFGPGHVSCGGGQPGACCITDMCFILTEDECDYQGGTFLPEPPCNPNPCFPSSPICRMAQAVAFGLLDQTDLGGLTRSTYRSMEVQVVLYDAGEKRR
jgi:hypothetical protein